MITRIVKMNFIEEKVIPFKELFRANCDKIRAMPGCNHLQLWQDVKDETTFFTYSIWDSEMDLENYRNSDLFRQVWSTTKVLFDERPQAWSVDKLIELI